MIKFLLLLLVIGQEARGVPMPGLGSFLGGVVDDIRDDLGSLVEKTKDRLATESAAWKALYGNGQDEEGTNEDSGKTRIGSILDKIKTRFQTIKTDLRGLFQGKVQLRITNELRKLYPGMGLLGDMGFTIPEADLPDDNASNTTRRKRQAINNNQARWTGGVIPYVIDSSLSAYTNQINAAFDEYHRKTCIRFVPRTNQRNYIMMFNGDGCYSYVGMANTGQQPVSLGQGCIYHGTIVHELGHAIGFFHEQNRSDRDTFLNIYYQNIQQGMESQFARNEPSKEILYTTFDYQSIMLYGNEAFTKQRGLNTMVAKNGVRLTEPYDKSGLSASDVFEVKKLYNCA